MAVGFDLDTVPHHAGDAGDRPDGKQQAQPKLFRPAQLNVIQDDERNRQQGKIEGHMQGAEGDADRVAVHTCDGPSHLSKCNHAVLLGRGVALENLQEHADDDVRQQQRQERIVRYRPSARGQAREAPIEQRDRHFDHSHRAVEEHFGDPG